MLSILYFSALPAGPENVASPARMLMFFVGSISPGPNTPPFASVSDVQVLPLSRLIAAVRFVFGTMALEMSSL